MKKCFILYVTLILAQIGFVGFAHAEYCDYDGCSIEELAAYFTADEWLPQHSQVVLGGDYFVVSPAPLPLSSSFTPKIEHPPKPF